MRSLLIQGQVILEALQAPAQSEFDQLWDLLQSSEVQGYISQGDLDQLFVVMVRTKGLEAASSILHYLSNVLTVHSFADASELDFLISKQPRGSFSDSWGTLPMLSVRAYLQRFNLDLLYCDSCLSPSPTSV